MKAVVIGCGRMGRRHMQVVKGLALELAGVMDLSREALELAAKEFSLSGTQLFTDAEKMLLEVRPELVVVATTAPSHAPLTCAAASAGAKYVLCEKPMATSLAECEEMIRACRASGTRFAVNHQMRFMEQYTVPKSILTQPAFGGLTSVNVLAGNFGLAMNGSHYFEMFRYLADEEPATVQAWFAPGRVPNPRGPQYEDRAGGVRLTTKSGKRFYMDIWDDQGHGMFVAYGARFGRITVDELTGDFHSAVRKPEHRDLPTTRYGMPWEEEDRKIAPADALKPTESVLKALLKGENYPDESVGLVTMRALVAAYISDEEKNRIVRLDEPLPVDRKFPWA